MPFGQHQDTELWNNQFPETKLLRLPVTRCMRALVYMMASRDQAFRTSSFKAHACLQFYMASRDKVDVDAFHKDIQYALEKLGKSKFGFKRTVVSKFLVDYSRAPCLGADQKAHALSKWE